MSSTVRSPGAFLASASLHAVLAALVVWFAWQSGKPKDEPRVFELVAGEGDNFAATEAPALGVPDVKIDIPEFTPIESPVMPEESPIEPVAPPVERIEPIKPVPPVKVVVKAPPVPKPVEKKKTPEKPPVKEVEPVKRMTKAEFDRLNKGKTATVAQKTPTKPIVTKRIDTAGIAAGVAGGSAANKTGGAGGKALTRQDVELSDAYIALLIQRLKQAHEKPEGLSDLLQTTVKFRLTSGGAVTNVVILSSSRSSEFDQSVLAAFRRITLPPPPANLRTNDYTLTFKMKEET